MFISNICGDIDGSRVKSLLWSLLRSLKEFFVLAVMECKCTKVKFLDISTLFKYLILLLHCTLKANIVLFCSHTVNTFLIKNILAIGLRKKETHLYNSVKKNMGMIKIMAEHLYWTSLIVQVYLIKCPLSIFTHISLLWLNGK